MQCCIIISKSFSLIRLWLAILFYFIFPFLWSQYYYEPQSLLGYYLWVELEWPYICLQLMEMMPWHCLGIGFFWFNCVISLSGIAFLKINPSSIICRTWVFGSMVHPTIMVRQVLEVDPWLFLPTCNLIKI